MSYRDNDDRSVGDAIFKWFIAPFLVVIVGAMLLGLGVQVYESLMRPWTWGDIGYAIFLAWGSLAMTLAILIGASRS